MTAECLLAVKVLDNSNICYAADLWAAWQTVKAELAQRADNSAMVPCPHLWIGTDGVHHTIINQCNHPLVKDWAQHQ